MSELAERFTNFYAAANAGAQPYPWQTRLVEQVAESGHWPDISAPTGAGKSSVIDAHTFLVSEHASDRLSVRPPRRLILVAPRRVIIDDQYERAQALAERLHEAEDDPGSGALSNAAGALRGLLTGQDGASPPLGVWKLRGGILLEDGWRLEPAACQIICATPQMWGSRLLFRGYGATRASRNLEAGLLGHDAVAIVDEAHLHGRLIETARAVASCSPGPLELQVVGMSATRTTSPGAAGLDASDLEDRELRRRVCATKRIVTRAVGDWRRDVQGAVVSVAQEVRTSGTVGVFVNDVPTALGVAQELAGAGRVELVCGRMRPADVERLRARRPGLLAAAGNTDVDFLVSTQSLEVGVDLDLAAMVTVLAPASAIAQRAGRLNRSGRFADSTLAVIVPENARADELERSRASGPYDAEELLAALRWLEELRGSISPLRVAEIKLPDRTPGCIPRLRGTDLALLAMSSDPWAADPDPELYLTEPERQVPEVGVVARRHLGLLDEVVRAALLACPPRQHELASLRLGREMDSILETVAAQAWVVRSAQGELDADRLAKAIPLQPGDVLVVPDGAAICTAGVVGLDGGRGSRDPLGDVLEEPPPGIAKDFVVPLPTGQVAPLVGRPETFHP